MIKANFQKFTALLIVPVILLSILFNIGCSDNGSKKDTQDNVNTSSMTKDLSTTKALNASPTKEVISEVYEYGTTVYSALNHSKFIELTTDTEQFSIIEILYVDRSNYGTQGPIQEDKMMWITCGSYQETTDYSSIDEFRGSYMHSFDNEDPPIEEFLEHNFSKSGVEVLFDYLELHEDYFFNGEELPETIELPDGLLCEGEYSFNLTIYKPDHQYAWAISKCTDDPDSIWQGLIDIINNDFFSKF